MMRLISETPMEMGAAAEASTEAMIAYGKTRENGDRRQRIGGQVRRLLWSIALLLPAVLGGCADKHGGTTSPAPTITMTAPARGLTGVPTNQGITATFTVAMNAASLNGTSFTLKPFSSLGLVGSVAGKVTMDPVNNIATFTPDSPLLPNTSYTATIDNTVKSALDGTAMADSYTWSFTTAPIPDTTPPTVIFTGVYGTTGATSGATGLPVNRASTVAFSEPMKSTTLNAATFTVTGPGGTPVAGAVTYIGITATFTPTANLAVNTLYTSTVTAGATDLAGNPLVQYAWSWTTAAAPDLIAPRVTVTNPANTAVNVPVYKGISATFSEEMRQSTIITTNFAVKKTSDGSNVPGTVAYDVQNNVATFIPQSDLAADTNYTVTVSPGATDLAGNVLVAGVVPNPWTFRTAPTPVPPTVTQTSPARSVINVPIDRSVTATFSLPMDSTSIVDPAGSFTLKKFGAVGNVPGTVTFDALSNIATFKPTASLDPGASYTATVSTQAKGLATGTTLAADYNWSFSTALTADVVPPTVIATGAFDGQTGLPINRASTATFSEAMAVATINDTTFTVTSPGLVPVAGVVSYIGTTATFTPNALLQPLTTYTSTITTAVTDLAGNHLVLPHVWNWTTAATLDITAPTVTLTAPINTATFVPVGTTITAAFSKEMKQSTMITSNFTLKETVSGNNVTGTVSYDVQTNSAVFVPADLLRSSTSYTATVTNGATDLAGNALVVPAVGLIANPWTFTTGVLVHFGPDAVLLGAAGEFNILAGSTVTNTDIPSKPTTINGLVGVSPGSGVIGLPTAAVPASQIHAADPVAVAAKAALLAAYNDAVSRSVNAITLPGNLGGLTYTPGLYVNSTSSGISGTGTSAIFTLDGQGDANAVWIFKMGSTFTTDSGTSVVLAGGAQAKNVFWQVGSSATLGTNSIFKGNILAQDSVTLTTGVNLQGRALTQTGAVTLDTNTIVLP